MKLSTKGRYAMVALADLALAEASAATWCRWPRSRSGRTSACPTWSSCSSSCAGPGWSRRCVARAAGLQAGASPDQIRISDVMQAVEETVDAMHTGAGRAGRFGQRAQSLTNRLWESLSANVYVFLHQVRLSDVVKNDLTPCPAVPSLFRVVDEE
jgi:Rrf2 family iron-sulfur cluster assembly transcriptional regulator